METRFILPVTVATALHAFVLFGISSPRTVTTMDPPDTPPVLPPLPKELIEVKLPPLDDETSAQARGTPRPDSPEEPLPWKSTFEQPVVHLPTSPGPPVERILPGPPGVPDGVIGVEWAAIPVVNSKFLDSKPRTRAQVQPVYPDEARRQGLTGEVWVEFVVDETGHVLNPRVVRSNNPLFDGPTLRAVERWRFEPGQKDHQTVRFRMAVPVVFNLEH